MLLYFLVVLSLCIIISIFTSPYLLLGFCATSIEAPIAFWVHSVIIYSLPVLSRRMVGVSALCLFAILGSWSLVSVGYKENINYMQIIYIRISSFFFFLFFFYFFISTYFIGTEIFINLNNTSVIYKHTYFFIAQNSFKR